MQSSLNRSAVSQFRARLCELCCTSESIALIMPLTFNDLTINSMTAEHVCMSDKFLIEVCVNVNHVRLVYSSILDN